MRSSSGYQIERGCSAGPEAAEPIALPTPGGGMSLLCLRILALSLHCRLGFPLQCTICTQLGLSLLEPLGSRLPISMCRPSCPSLPLSTWGAPGWAVSPFAGFGSASTRFSRVAGSPAFRSPSLLHGTIFGPSRREAK